MTKPQECGSEISYFLHPDGALAQFNCPDPCRLRRAVNIRDENQQNAKTRAIDAVTDQQLQCPRGKMGGSQRRRS